MVTLLRTEILGNSSRQSLKHSISSYDIQHQTRVTPGVEGDGDAFFHI